MNLQTAAAIIGAYAALFAGIWAVITRPIERGLDRIDKRLDRIESRLDSIDTKLDGHGDRITRLEERRYK